MWKKLLKTGDCRKWVTLQYYYSFTLFSYYNFGTCFYCLNQSTLHIKSNLCFAYLVLLLLFFFKLCIRIQWYIVSSVFWRKKNDVHCFSLPNFVSTLWGNRCTYQLTVFISEKHILGTYFGENFIDIWGGADFGPYSPPVLSFSSSPLKPLFQYYRNNARRVFVCCLQKLSDRLAHIQS